jgi:lipopolysaccharide/colanic/teichoic acid biosynthesis glycosyltransferase
MGGVGDGNLENVKRAFDIIASLLLLVLAAPVMLAVALAVLLSLGTPIFFRQIRPGLGGKPFMLVKFRTMGVQAGAAGTVLPDEKRLTAVGRFLRASSFDELPELWNVLKGEMSLVGPRPLLMEYLPLYSPEQARRHEVRPGITGWAQVNGRNALSWEEKFALDVWYVGNRSFGLDMRIIARSLGIVLRREGISAAGEATMPKFTGTGR